MSKTNISELAEFFPANKPAAKPAQTGTTLVAARFWKPGMTYQQAKAAQQRYFDEVAQRAAARAQA